MARQRKIDLKLSRAILTISEYYFSDPSAAILILKMHTNSRTCDPEKTYTYEAWPCVFVTNTFKRIFTASNEG